jgi:hypothetical protein
VNCVKEHPEEKRLVGSLRLDYCLLVAKLNFVTRTSNKYLQTSIW